ncbi:MAG: hypothetical protein R6U92_02840, partial [Bacillota bacterium]
MGTSPSIFVILPDLLHFHQREEQVLFLAELFQPLIVQLSDRPALQVKLVRLEVRAGRFSLVADDDVLNAIVGQDFAGDTLDILVGDISGEGVLACCADVLGLTAHVGHGGGYGLCDRIG